MEKRKISLSYGSRLLTGICVLLSICLFITPEYYSRTINADFDSEGFPFLQEGSYVLSASYDNAPEGYYLVVSTDSLTDSSNQIGKVYADVAMPSGTGHNCVEVPISLDQSAEHITIRMEYRGKDAKPDVPEPPVMTQVNIKGNEIFCRDNQFLGGLCRLRWLQGWPERKRT